MKNSESSEVSLEDLRTAITDCKNNIMRGHDSTIQKLMLLVSVILGVVVSFMVNFLFDLSKQSNLAGFLLCLSFIIVVGYFFSRMFKNDRIFIVKSEEQLRILEAIYREKQPR